MQYYDNEAVRAASARVAAAHAHNRSKADIDALRRKVSVAKIDREIRRSLEDSGPLDPGQIRHIVGLLLGGGSEQAFERAEAVTRELLDMLPLNEGDRTILAALLLTYGGTRA